MEELEDSEPTAKFLKYMNNLFDCLNRRYAGEGIRPGSPDIDVSIAFPSLTIYRAVAFHVTLFLQTIKEAISFLDSWESEVKNGDIKEENFLTKETAEGLQVTLHAILGIIDYLPNVCGFTFVLTAKLTQDILEASLHLRVTSIPLMGSSSHSRIDCDSFLKYVLDAVAFPTSRWTRLPFHLHDFNMM